MRAPDWNNTRMTWMTIRALTSLGVVVVIATLWPAASNAMQIDSIDELRAEVAALAARVTALEQENRSLKDATEPTAEVSQEALAASYPSQSDHVPIRFGGDFRYRYEWADLEGTERRDRSRIRARIDVEAVLAPNLSIGVGFATGGTSPVSSTQTLGNGGSKKDIALDLAYFDWAAFDHFHLLAGKFRNPLLELPSHKMLWDDEWRPEGIGLNYDNERFFARVLGSWFESDSASLARELMVGGQAGIRYSIGLVQLTAGVGYFDIGTKGKQPFYGEASSVRGNTLDCMSTIGDVLCTFRYNYQEAEAFAAVKLPVYDSETVIYGHLVDNADVDQRGRAWTLGAQLKTEIANQIVTFDYFYRDVGADALFEPLSDSDFAGGTTDSAGNYFKLGWAVSPKWVLSATYFRNSTGASNFFSRNYRRLQLNADFKY